MCGDWTIGIRTTLGAGRTGQDGLKLGRYRKPGECHRLVPALFLLFFLSSFTDLLLLPLRLRLLLFFLFSLFFLYQDTYLTHLPQLRLCFLKGQADKRMVDATEQQSSKARNPEDRFSLSLRAPQNKERPATQAWPDAGTWHKSQILEGKTALLSFLSV